MKIQSKNLDKLLSIFDNYHGQYDKVLNCLLLDNEEESIGALLQIINNLIKEDNLVNNINSVNNMLDYIDNYLKENRDIDKTILNRTLTKILESINTVLIDEKYEDYNKKEYRTKYYHLSRKIMKLPIEKDENTKYLEILWTIITKVKNIDYLNKSIEVLNIENKVFKDSHTIIMELVSLYIEKTREIYTYLDDVTYYNSVIKLILFNKFWNVSEVEKEWCRNILSQELKVLNKKDYNFLKIKFIDDILQSFNYSFDSSKMLCDLSTRYNINIENSTVCIDNLDIDKRLSKRVIATDYIISIDSYDTKEIDDCLSCKKLEDDSYLLGIHIVDIFGYIDITNEIIRDALTRAETIYLQDLLVYMLPKELATDKASFVENKPRYAISDYFVIKKDGTITSNMMMKTIITNNKKSTYEEVNKVLSENKKDNSEFNITVRNLRDVKKILERKLFSNYNIENDNSKKSSTANKIVSYLMTLENLYIAKYFSENDYPLIYRMSDNTEDDFELENFLNEKNIDLELDELLYQIRKGPGKVIYGTNGCHSELGSLYYCHSTSPLRRFADLWNRYLISIIKNKNISKERLEELKEKTEQIVLTINEVLNRHEYFSIEYNKKIKQMK
ncbi:MAG: RNB domain-containing ribonuclease [Bacilli bacterium]|nr:RNB domain-containing ribonuclease [Bacilli bacterium]